MHLVSLILAANEASTVRTLQQKPASISEQLTVVPKMDRSLYPIQLIYLLHFQRDIFHLVRSLFCANNNNNNNNTTSKLLKRKSSLICSFGTADNSLHLLACIIGPAAWCLHFFREIQSAYWQQIRTVILLAGWLRCLNFKAECKQGYED